MLEVGKKDGSQGIAEHVVTDMEEETRRMKIDYPLIFYLCWHVETIVLFGSVFFFYFGLFVSKLLAN